jgi:hypothetical protein
MKPVLYFFLFLSSSFLFAQTPQAINYQGIARTATGDPIADKDIALRISIRQGSPTGPAAYIELHNVTTNRLGLFAIELGRGIVINGQFETINWGSTSHFVEVELDETGGLNFFSIGTSPLLAVPYALYAAKASEVDGLWNQNSAGIDFIDGKVGIGTASPDYTLDIRNHEPEGFERFQINLQNQSDSDRSFAGLSVTSGSNSSDTYLVHHSNSYALEGDKLSDYGQLMSTGKGLILRVDNPVGDIKFLTGYTPGFSSPERMRIDAQGHVGIGTETPKHSLDISNTEASSNERFQVKLQNHSDSDRSFAGLSVTSGSNSSNTYLVHHSTTYGLEGDKLSDYGQLMSTGKGLILRVDNPIGDIKFLTGYTPGLSSPERMRITADGNVGIGTEDPAAKIQVTGGDVFIENIDSGVIMKSPNGNCWRVTMNNDGTLKSTAIACPN